MRITALSSACVCTMSLVLGLSPLTAEDEKKADVKTKEVKVRELTLHIPETWKQKEARGLRVAQISVPAVEKDKEKGEGEYIVFYFPMGGGDAAANVQRWTNQFDEKDRKVKVYTGETKGGKYTLADISGAYNKGPPGGPTKKLEGWRVLAVVLQQGDEQYYIRYDAPQASAAENVDLFRKTFGANAKAEKEEKPEEK